jgi:hypothetical protein
MVLMIVRGSMMQATPERNLLFHTLCRMMDRLCSPDLTAAEAKVLRPQLDDLLVKIHDFEKSASATMDRIAGSRVL